MKKFIKKYVCRAIIKSKHKFAHGWKFLTHFVYYVCAEQKKYMNKLSHFANC